MNLGMNTTVVRCGYLGNIIVVNASTQKAFMHLETNLFFNFTIFWSSMLRIRYLQIRRKIEMSGFGIEILSVLTWIYLIHFPNETDTQNINEKP